MKYGWSFPVFVWKDKNTNYVIDGHCRLLVLNELETEGYIIPKLPVVYIECKNKKEAKQKLLRLNSQYGKMTKESVLEFVEDLDLNFEEIALPEGVIDFTDQSEESPEREGDDETPDYEEKAVSKRGEIYQLGNSFLMCGDSTSEEDINRLLNGVRINLVLTDPPYGIDVVQGKSIGGGKVCKVHTYEKIIGDETTDTAEKSYKIYKELSDNQIIFGGNYFTDFLNASRCWLVWDKQNTGNFADAELAWTSFDKGVKLYKHLWNGMSREGNRTDEGKTRVHPTQKPVGMLQKILEDFTEAGETVLDVFGGCIDHAFL